MRVGRFSKLSSRGLWLAALPFIALSSANSQTAPDLHWKQFRTAHFVLTFNPSLERVARQAAGSAERAYATLAKELHEPRGPIDLIVADNLDVSNGYATVFPSNRIVIYARPSAIDGGALRFNDDWIDFVVSHELTHIFHLDRSRNIWAVGQAIFGRNPFLFPNAYAPSWLSEGIAVHYESKLTGAGRDVGTDFAAVARAHELGGNAPGAHDLSVSSPLYPLGNVAYVYGAPLIEQMIAHAKTGSLTAVDSQLAAQSSMRRFIDHSAAQWIPFLLNTTAQDAFGITFDSAFALWADSVHRNAQLIERRAMPPAAIARGGWFSTRPRWVDDSTVIWSQADIKSVPSLRSVNVSGTIERRTAAKGESAGRPVRVIAERNSDDATSPLPNGWRVFAQREYTDPYTQRSDLYLEREGRQDRLTVGMRMIEPDARICDAAQRAAMVGDGGSSFMVVRSAPAAPVSATDLCITAVQINPFGGAQLVTMVASDSGRTALRGHGITSGNTESIFSEPRWSHAGDRIAAAHWERNGNSEIVVMSPGGVIMNHLGFTRGVVGSPAWGKGDSTIFFTSDRSGRSALYRANVNTGALARVADSPTGLYEADVSPDGMRVATFLLWGDGLDLAIVDANARGTPADATSVLPPSRGTPSVFVSPSEAPANEYSAWRSALPTYWLPEVDQGDGNRYAYGLSTSGYDLVGRHNWALTATYEPQRGEPSLSAGYSFAGVGNPVISLGADEVWDHFSLADTAGHALGTLARRKVIGSGAVTFLRPRYRSAMSLTLGGSYEWRDFRTHPSALETSLPASLRRSYTFPSIYASAGFSNARTPALALGPEDGITVGLTIRQRWRSDSASGTRSSSYSGALALYSALDFGGPVHHLLAARVAFAHEDITAPTEFSAGGNSGSIVQIAPGVTFGDGRRSFFVRGYAPGTQTGSVAVGGNVEYRFPISLPGSGIGALPVFLQRVSGVFFGDAAAAYCPQASATSAICPRVTDMFGIASYGAELHLDAAVPYDTPYRLRLGVALTATGARKPNVYASVGLPF